jgi:hypothetical protein
MQSPNQPVCFVVIIEFRSQFCINKNYYYVSDLRFSEANFNLALN